MTSGPLPCLEDYAFAAERCAGALSHGSRGADFSSAPNRRRAKRPISGSLFAAGETALYTTPLADPAANAPSCFIINFETRDRMIPSSLNRPGAARFWSAVILTACGTGIAAAALTRLLEFVQRLMWGGTGTNLLETVSNATPWRHV